jgi:hypothetical protein
MQGIAGHQPESFPQVINILNDLQIIAGQFGALEDHPVILSNNMGYR